MAPLFFLIIRPVSLPTLRDFSDTALLAAVRFCVASRVGWLQALVIVRGTGKGFSGSGPSRVVGEPSFCVTVFSVCGAGGCLRAARKFFGGLFTVNRAVQVTACVLSRNPLRRAGKCAREVCRFR